MKKIKLLIALTLYAFLIQECLSQSIIWSEDFPYDDGTTIGSGIPPKWTINWLPSADRWEVRGNKMEARGTDSEGIWTSESINISSISDITVSVDLFQKGKMEAVDYIGVYYILDGGEETVFETNGYLVDEFKFATASQSGLSGNSLVIIIRLLNDENKETHRFDNVQVIKSITGDFCSNAFPINEARAVVLSQTENKTAIGISFGAGMINVSYC